MPKSESRVGGLVGLLEYTRDLSIEASATSGGLGWAGLEAAGFWDLPELSNFEVDRPPLTHHTLVLFIKPPIELDLRYESVKRLSPPPPGSVSVVPAGVPCKWRWYGRKDSLHVFLEPELISRVAAEAFELDPARVSVPPLDSLNLPQFQTAMRAVEHELRAGDGGHLAAESLANLLAVHLIRAASAPDRKTQERGGVLPHKRLRAAVEYIEEHLDACLTLGQIAAAAHLSPYHFARQFKAATGMPPHQYVIARRVERARELLCQGDLALAEVAACTGFSDQSQFCHHFKRLVGVTPSSFRKSARNT